MILRKRTVLICCLSAAASLQASVTTQVQVYNGNDNVAYGYNAGVGQVPVSPTTGYGSYGGCYPTDNQPGGNTCTIAFTGTTDKTGKLPSASDTVSLKVTTPPNALGEPGHSAIDSASVWADVTQAKLGVSASTPNVPANGIDVGGEAKGWAQINDGLHFSVAGAGANTVTAIGVSFTVNGSLSSPAGQAEALAELQAALNIGSANFLLTDSAAYNGTTRQDNAGGWASWSVSPNAPGEGFTFQGMYDLTGSTTDLTIGESLYTDAGGGGVSDYAHTATLSFDLPTGVTFTSDSGDFLSAVNTSPAPEPAAYLLIGSGLGALGLLRRKLRS